MNETVYLLQKLLETYGFDLSDPDFKRTPERMDKMFREVCSSHFINVDEQIDKLFEVQFPTTYEGLVIVEPIPFVAICPHHFLSVFGNVYLGVVSGDSVVGLSKYPRLVKLLASKPVKQEDFTQNLVNTIYDRLECKGVMAVVKATHTCMTIRGVKAPGVITTTSSVKGIFDTDLSLKAEFMSLIGDV